MADVSDAAPVYVLGGRDSARALIKIRIARAVDTFYTTKSAELVCEPRVNARANFLAGDPGLAAPCEAREYEGIDLLTKKEVFLKI